VLGYTLCPLTRKFMKHPVVWGNNKRACEKDAVEKYMHEHQMDPITHERINASNIVLMPNLNIAQLCFNYEPSFGALSAEKRIALIEYTLSTSIQADSIRTEDSSSSSQAFFQSAEEHSQIEARQQTTSEEIDSSLLCPITSGIMRDPVILVASGHTYEREAIENWFQNHNTDPLTGEALRDKSLIPNYALKGLCHQALNRSGISVSIG